MVKAKNGKRRPDYKPNKKARKALLEKLKYKFHEVKCTGKPYAGDPHV